MWLPPQVEAGRRYVLVVDGARGGCNYDVIDSNPHRHRLRNMSMGGRGAWRGGVDQRGGACRVARARGGLVRMVVDVDAKAESQASPLVFNSRYECGA